MCDKTEPVYRLSDGRIVPPGPLYRRRDGRVEEPAPVACPAGHPLGPKRVLVGWRSCDQGGHRTHTCVRCGATIYTPPITSACVHKNTGSS